MLAHVSHHYRKFTEPQDDLKFMDEVIAGLTDNSGVFTAPTVSVVNFTKTKGDYEKMITDASSGDKKKIADRDAFRVSDVIPALNANANYVDSVANGDAAIILLSGYHATKTDRSKPTRPDKMALSIFSSLPGQIEWESKTPVKAHQFILIINVAGATIMQNIDTISIESKGESKTLFLICKKKGIFGGLPSGAIVTVQIFACGSQGSGALSDPVSIRVQ